MNSGITLHTHTKGRITMIVEITRVCHDGTKDIQEIEASDNFEIALEVFRVLVRLVKNEYSNNEIADYKVLLIDKSAE